MDTENGYEKRQFKRRTHAEAVHLQFNDPALFGGCLSCDLSEGGIRLRLAEFIPLNTQVTLQIQLSDEKTIECVGRVIWVEKSRFGYDYQVGLEFEKARLPFEAQREIRSFLTSS